MPDNQQPETSIAEIETQAIAVSDLATYKRQRKQQLLAQCNDIIDLRADVERRKLTHIINHAVASAFL